MRSRTAFHFAFSSSICFCNLFFNRIDASIQLFLGSRRSEEVSSVLNHVDKCFPSINPSFPKLEMGFVLSERFRIHEPCFFENIIWHYFFKIRIGKMKIPLLISLFARPFIMVFAFKRWWWFVWYNSCSILWYRQVSRHS